MKFLEACIEARKGKALRSRKFSLVVSDNKISLTHGQLRETFYFDDEKHFFKRLCADNWLETMLEEDFKVLN
jgi:hypothetical protein